LKNNLHRLIQQKELTENRKIGIRELALESGVSFSTLYRILNQGDIPKIPTIERLCRYFNCEIGDLIYIESPHQQSQFEIMDVMDKILSTPLSNWQKIYDMLVEIKDKNSHADQ